MFLKCYGTTYEKNYVENIFTAKIYNIIFKASAAVIKILRWFSGDNCVFVFFIPHAKRHVVPLERPHVFTCGIKKTNKLTRLTAVNQKIYFLL